MHHGYLMVLLVLILLVNAQRVNPESCQGVQTQVVEADESLVEILGNAKDGAIALDFELRCQPTSPEGVAPRLG